MKPRDYQELAIVGIMQEFVAANSTLLVLPTGCGKTVVFAELIRRCLPQRAMVLAHRSELIFQAQQKIEAIAGIECGVEMADMVAGTTFFSKCPVVVSTVQTQKSGPPGKERMTRFDPMDFGLLIIDECFPAGTLVGDVPIEKIKVGDFVSSFNHLTGEIERRKVLRLFKNPAKDLLRIQISNGAQIVCTPSHPFFDGEKYVPAHSLCSGSVVFCTNEQLENTKVHLRKTVSSKKPKLGEVFSNGLFRALQGENLIKKAQGCFRAVHEMWKKSKMHRAARIGHGETAKGLLRATVPGDCSPRGFVSDNVAHEQEVCVHENEIEKSNVQSVGEGKNDTINAGENIYFSRRQRSNNEAAGNTFQCFAVADGISDCNGWCSWAVPFIASLLQGGFGKSRVEIGNRSGRKNTQAETLEISRPKKNRNLECARVDGVEILERGGDGKFGGLCEDGFTYNIEVEGNNNYFAAGVLVHNCHHAASKSYKQIIAHYRQNPNLKVLGVTATPDRADEIALGEVFETVAFDYEILDAIHGGYLVPIDQQFVAVHDLDFSAVRTTAGDLNGADLARLMEEEKNMQRVAGASIEIIGDKRTLVFTASVKQAETLCNIFNRHREGMAGWVCGKTDRETRRQLLKDFESGAIQVVVNCGVLTEGYDNPAVEIIVMARPTKSRSLYSQMVGRGTRSLTGTIDHHETADARKSAIANSGKPSVLVVDFVGNSGRHKLMTSADILGGKNSEEAIELAKEKAKAKGGRVKMSAVLDESELEIRAARLEAREQARLQEEARKARLVAKASFSRNSVDPFDRYQVRHQPANEWDKRNGRVLSEKQRAIIRNMGVDPDKISFSCGKQMVGAYFSQPTPKQLLTLTKHGYDCQGMTKDDASKAIDALAKNGWRKPA